MNINDFKNMTRITPVMKIHDDLFKETVSYQYYLLGIAQGLGMLYKMAEQMINYSYTSEELMQIIKLSLKDNEEVGKYFIKLIDENIE